MPSPAPEGESREEKIARLRAAVARTEAGWKTRAQTHRTAIADSETPALRPTTNRPLDHRSLRERMSRYRRPSAEDDPAPVAAPRAEEGHERSDHDYPLSARYGRVSLLRLPSIPRSLSARLETDPARSGVDFGRALFVDTETSGLSGGTGTFAFLIGVGRVSGDSFRVTQFRLKSLSGEREMLEEVAAFVGGNPEIVSYNGTGFDLPLLETRFAMNELPNPFADSRHFDLLPLARRLFIPRHENARLIHLEAEVLGVERDDDIPGARIPSIFFEALRNGGHPAMESVLSHHRYDILTLPALSLEAASRLKDGWDSENGEDLLGVAQHLWKREEREAATLLFERALDAGLSRRNRHRCLLFLGEQRKREGDWSGAITLWQQVEAADTREYLESLEWLAKYEEHQRGDFERALAHVHDAQDRLPRIPDWSEEAIRRHRSEWSRRAVRLEARLAERPSRRRTIRGNTEHGDSASVMTCSAPEITPTSDGRETIVTRIRSYLALSEPPPEADPTGNPVIYPSADAVKEAVRFVNLLPPRIPLPKVGRADDGEINLIWRNGDAFIDVGVRGDGEIVYFARVERSGIVCDGTASIAGEPLPRDLAAAIVSIRE